MMQLRTPSYSCFEILHLLKDLLVFRHTGSGSRKPCSTDNPLVHLDGPEAERSVFGVLCLNACPAQSGQAEHPREGYPSSCSWNSPSYVLPLLLPPCVRRSAPPPEQLLQNHRCCLRARPPPPPPRAFPHRGKAAAAAARLPFRGWTRTRGTRQPHNVPRAAPSGQADRRRSALNASRGGRRHGRGFGAVQSTLAKAAAPGRRCGAGPGAAAPGAAPPGSRRSPAAIAPRPVASAPRRAERPHRPLDGRRPAGVGRGPA